MSEDETLTPAERKLCGGLLVLAGAGVVVLGYYQELVSSVIDSFVSHWVGRSLPALRAGRFPPLDFLSILFAGLVSGAMGAIFLCTQYLAQLLGWGRCLRLRTLWFWTMIFGAFTSALALTILPVLIAPGFGALLIINGIVGLRFGGDAWGLRKGKSASAE